MKKHRRTTKLGIAAALSMTFLAAGCTSDSAEREKKIREGAAKAAEAAKPPLQEAARDVKAAVEGAKEGWDRAGEKRIDLNSATEEDLTGLPGVGRHEAKKIISGRPYRDAHDLVTKKVMSESAYEKLKTPSPRSDGKRQHYSSRRATTGSTCVARSAGT